MTTLVVHITDPSTDFLKPIYAGRGWTEIHATPNGERDAFVQALDHERVIMLGHGSPTGLFGTHGRWAVSNLSVPGLRHRPNIYIWCHADKFVRANSGLQGFFSGMFISEVGEASFLGIQTDEAAVQRSNRLFVEVVANHVDESPSKLAMAVRAGYVDRKCPVVTYNRNLVGSC